MKLINLLLTAILLAGHSFVYGQQEEPKAVKRINIHDISIRTGMFSGDNTTGVGTLTGFRELAPQSILLSNDFTEYSSSRGFSRANSNILSVMLGIQFSDKQKTAYKKNPQLRVGISYFSGTSLNVGSQKEQRERQDTLVSFQTGETGYADSVTTHHYGMSYISEQLRFDGSLIFRTNSQARWSLYGGLGITAGVSIKARTEVYYNKNEALEVIYPSTTDYYSSSSLYSGYRDKTETHRNKSNFGFSTYLPMGIGFRLGKKREFWKQVNLFYELRPSIDITSIPELRTITNTSIQHGIGLKVSWN